MRKELQLGTHPTYHVAPLLLSNTRASNKRFLNLVDKLGQAGLGCNPLTRR